MKSVDDLQAHFEYELAPLPPALFTEQGMRKTSKSSFYSVFNKISTHNQGLDDAAFILDGGFLLHRVTWPSHIYGLTYDKVYDTCISYVKQHYH